MNFYRENEDSRPKNTFSGQNPLEFNNEQTNPYFDG